MLSEYSHTKTESLAQISTPLAEIHNFLGDYFYRYSLYISPCDTLNFVQTCHLNTSNVFLKAAFIVHVSMLYLLKQNLKPCRGIFRHLQTGIRFISCNRSPVH